jgi:uncharacterized protein (TIGR00251 family)
VIEPTGHPEGAIVRVRAQPGARREGFLGEHAGALKIAVAAAPEQGKANEAVARVLADLAGCKRSQVALLKGASSRDKTFLLSGVDPDALRARLAGA